MTTSTGSRAVNRWPALRGWRTVAFVATAVLATACGSSSTDRAGSSATTSLGTSEDGEIIEVEQIPGDEPDVTISALEDADADGLPEAIIDVSQIRSGGPRPDGIPPVDEPKFHRAGSVGFLRDEEPVVSVQLGEDARAYPLQIMVWHEIVNDTIDGVPVSVTYCPLCNSAVAYERRLGDRTLTFGTSGKLFNSALVMYDRQTESLWSHFTSQALAGVLAGERLRTLPAPIVSWGDWRAAHPDGLVLSRETGEQRDYGTNPYPGYDDVDNPPFLFSGEVDGRLAAKERVVALGLDRDPVAIRLDELSDRGVVDVTVRGTHVTVWHKPGTASALDRAELADGKDVGATAAFDRELDGRRLTFSRVDNGFTDAETGSVWDIFGRAVSGRLAGQELERVEHVDTFWFAWAAYQPDTRLD